MVFKKRESEWGKLLGVRIAMLRIRAGMSQAVLAERLHVSPSTIGSYEQGRREPSVDTLVALSKEFGVTVDYLVTGSLCAISDPRISVQSQHILDALSELNNLSREDLLILLITKIVRE